MNKRAVGAIVTAYLVGFIIGTTKYDILLCILAGIIMSILVRGVKND
jgi:hypothetical protein